MNKKNGDPDGNYPISAQLGISLLDYFAAKVMEGIVRSGYENSTIKITQKSLAKFSYDMAETMIKEKEKRDAK
jgi:hypothetical protein